MLPAGRTSLVGPPLAMARRALPIEAVLWLDLVGLAAFVF
jgi:hypothetical protein